MIGDVEGYALSLIDQYKEVSWPIWEDITTGEGDEATTTIGLHTIIE